MTYVALIMWQIVIVGWQAPLEGSVLIENFPNRASCDAFAYGHLEEVIDAAARDPNYEVPFAEHRCLSASEYELLLGSPS